MREIKFRVWNKQARHFWEWNDLNAYNLVALSRDEGWEFQQFSGLKDRKGKEIYEGDIVNYPYTSLKPEYWEVAWGFDSWIMERGERVTGDRNCADDPNYNDWEIAEVIGNIYENPELLEEK